MYFLLGGIIAFYGLVTGTTPAMPLFGYPVPSRIESAVGVVLAVAFVVGIYRRARFVPWLLFVLLAVMWFDWISSLLLAAYKQGISLMLSLPVAVVASTGLAYSVYRFHQQKKFFWQTEGT